MDSIATWVGIIAGILAIIGTVVAVTRHLTVLQEKGEREAVVAENRTLSTKIQSLEGRQAQLLDQIAVAGRAGSAALSQKGALDTQLQALMQLTGATGGSIYVPVRSPRGDVHGLAFLCIEPFSTQTQILKSKVIPLKSLAGRCFTSGRSFAVSNASENPDHFQAADRIIDYRPSTTLNLAIQSDGHVVGVLQLLSKQGEAGFSDGDVARVEALLGALPDTVVKIAQTPDYLRVLGLAEEGAATLGSVVYFDLSRSSLLFQELSSAFALQLLNEYFEQMCEAAFRLGATLDNYMGDGALMRFNIPRPIAEHELAAVTAAIEMNRSFAELKDYWVAISPRLEGIHHRAGIDTGPLLRANLGHSQVQSLTVIGYPIAVAAALCDTADRDRNVILIGDETWKVVKDRVIASPIATDRLGKAATFTSSAYEVTGFR
jgi:class 3 adenylate cyclase